MKNAGGNVTGENASGSTESRQLGSAPPELLLLLEELVSPEEPELLLEELELLLEPPEELLLEPPLELLLLLEELELLLPDALLSPELLKLGAGCPLEVSAPSEATIAS